MPIRLCSDPACREQATHRGRCAKHRSEYQRAHRSPHRRIYDSKRWTETRKRKLFNQSLCERCGAIATDVHHVVDLEDGGPPFDSWNLESICKRCHGRHTRRTIHARMRSI